MNNLLNNSQDILYSLLGEAKSAALIGMCKNAGKTTVLNTLISAFNKNKKNIALTSVGRDGESVDVVTATKKPRIYVYKNTLIATAAGLLNRCTATIQILDTTPLQTPLGRVILLRTLSDGYVEIAGPSVSSSLNSIKSFAAQNTAFLLIDGAINRKSPSGARIADTIILCTGASYSANMDKTVNDTAFWVKMFSLPLMDDNQRAVLTLNLPDKTAELKKLLSLSDCVFVKGALSEEMLKGALLNKDIKGKVIAVEDASKIIAGREIIERFYSRGGVLKTVNKINLAAVTVNPFSARGDDYEPSLFLDEMAKAVNTPVFDVIAAKHVIPQSAL